MSESVKTRHRRSVSQLQSYAKCSYDYYLSRVLKVPQRQASWFIQGTAWHSAVEAYERSGREMSVLDALGVFEAAWEVDTAEAERLQPDPKMWMVGGRKRKDTDAEQRWDLGHRQVEEYIEHHPKDGEWLPLELAPGQLAIEVEFEVMFGSVLVVGVIDAIKAHRDGLISVDDGKTGTKKPLDPYQMVTYKFVVEDLFGIHVDLARWWMCKDADYEVFDQLHNYSRGELVEWYERLDYGVENKIFLANPGDHCFVCTSYPYCKYANPYAKDIEPYLK